MAAVSITMSKFIAGIVIAILASSAVSVGVSMLITGPQGPEGPQGEEGPQGPQGEEQEPQDQQAQLDRQDPLEQRGLLEQLVLLERRDREALECHRKATFQFHFLHLCHHPLATVSHTLIQAD
jgi:hypothetical protein